MDHSGLWETKTWGQTRCDYHCSRYSRHTLRTKAGGVCSVHYHKDRLNNFHVISGRVVIVESYGWDIVRTVLGPGMSWQVHSLVAHQFQSLCDSQMIEEYWPDRGGEVRIDDIERLSEGYMHPDLEELRNLSGFAVKDT